MRFGRVVRLSSALTYTWPLNVQAECSIFPFTRALASLNRTDVSLLRCSLMYTEFLSTLSCFRAAYTWSLARLDVKRTMTAEDGGQAEAELGRAEGPSLWATEMSARVMLRPSCCWHSSTTASETDATLPTKGRVDWVCWPLLTHGWSRGSIGKRLDLQAMDDQVVPLWVAVHVLDLRLHLGDLFVGLLQRPF